VASEGVQFFEFFLIRIHYGGRVHRERARS
jgi:hypothetical protein